MTMTKTWVIYFGQTRGVRRAMRTALAEMFGVPKSHVEFRECARGEEDTEIARTPSIPGAIRTSWARLTVTQQDMLRDAIDSAR